MNLGTQSDAGKDPDRLEREIDEQRREINETLRALEEKFSSKELASQFAHYFTGPGREWIDTLGSSVRSNPVPTLLTAVGLAWLMMSDRNRSAYRGPYRAQRAYGTGYRAEYAGEYGPGYGEEDEGRMRGMMEGAAGSAHAMHDAAHSAYEHAGEKAGELRDRVAGAGASLHDKAAHMRESLHDKAANAREALHNRREAWQSRAHDARGGLHDSAESLRDNFGRMAHDQPLALGAIGIALGAIIGAALPRTQHENRVLGRASERIKEKGREMAHEGYVQASRKAAEVVEAAEETLQHGAEANAKGQSGSDEQHMWQGSSENAGTPRQQPDSGASLP
ncbi:MAG TPA: DUF3618 domain-containing protein [Pseudomonadales bacterium]